MKSFKQLTERFNIEWDTYNGFKCALRNDILDYLDTASTGCGCRQNDQLHNYPSSAADCIRKGVYGWLGYESLATPFDIQRKMDAGTLFHPYFAMMWTRAGFFADVEPHGACKEDNVSFYPDFIGRVNFEELVDKIKLPVGTKFVVEFKTAGVWTFKNITPNLGHVSQLNYYLGAEGLEDGFLHYWCKDHSKWATGCDRDSLIFHFKFSQKRYDSLIKRFKKVKSYVDKNEIPDREKNASKSKYPCSGCQYRHICW